MLKYQYYELPIDGETENIHQRAVRAYRRLQDEICEEHRLMSIRTGHMAGRFSQSGQIAYELYLARKGK